MCERERVSTCVMPGERLRQSLRKQTKNEVPHRGLNGKEMQKNHFKVHSLEEKLLISFSWLPMNMMKAVRCVHVDIREVRDNCGFAYSGQGQIMYLSQSSGHVDFKHTTESRCSFQV